MNTQSSAQLGSHWFTVVVGAAVKNSSLLLESTASSSAAGGMLQSSQPAPRGDPIANNYPNLFESPDPDLSNALAWAHANAMQPHTKSCKFLQSHTKSHKCFKPEVSQAPITHRQLHTTVVSFSSLVAHKCWNPQTIILAQAEHTTCTQGCLA